MNWKELRWGRLIRASVGSAVVVGVVGAGGCLSRPLEPQDTRTTATIVERLTESSVDKIDIVLAIDNSRSMADKQNILVQAVPKLVGRLVNPLCVDPMGVPAATQPAYGQPCPTGTKPEFKAVKNIHIGVTDSSLGNHAGQPLTVAACPDSFADTSCMLPAQTSNNDHGELVYRTDAYSMNGTVPTYNGSSGFLAWDPGMILMPAGTADLPTLITGIGDLVKGVGQVGCGYEAQLEGVYRFLIDPNPYGSISKDSGGNAVPMGTDMTLLAQRKAFLRPDSLLAVIMLTDENDCSTKEYGFYWEMTESDNGAFHIPKATAVCASNPNDPCCYNCSQNPIPSGCSPDPACADWQTEIKSVDAAKRDPINLRCWNQKQRFGIDFLYGLDRYVNGFSQYKIPDAKGNLVQNPIFSDLDPSDTDSNIRDPSLVFYAGIVGVPWQDVARDPKDISKGFKNSDEMLAPVGGTMSNTWDVILGQPWYTLEPGANGYTTAAAGYTAPLDPLMIESQTPRMGTNPITMEAVGLPPATNSINGHEWDTSVDASGDLQYACIFPLLSTDTRSCTMANTCKYASCDCDTETTSTANNPLCDADPNNGGLATLQTRAKGYPGVRELGVLRYMAAQGIVASICPQTVDPTAPDNAYGYNPAVGSIIDRLKVALGGQCLPRTLKPNAQGQVQCLVIEAKVDPSGQHCDPNQGRVPVPSTNQAAITAIKNDSAANPSWNSFCEIPQLVGMPLSTCQQDVNDPTMPSTCSSDPNQQYCGWCYIDATTVPAIGNPQIVAQCSENEKRLVRFVNAGDPSPGGTLFITCSGEF